MYKNYKNSNLYIKNQSNEKNGNHKRHKHNSENPQDDNIPRTLADLKKRLNKDFDLLSDLNLREFQIGSVQTPALVVSIDGFIDKKTLSVNVIEPLMKLSGTTNNTSIIDYAKQHLIYLNDIEVLDSYQKCIDTVLNGDAVVFIDNETNAFRIGVRAPEKRAITESDTEISLKGSREGFNENLRTNTILLRRRIRNNNLKIENLTLGEQSKTNISICYLEGIAPPEIVDEVKKRLKKIETDAVLGVGVLEQYIEDSKYPFIPLVGNSEKPDKVAAKLLEGRVAILADGTPTVLTVPFLLIECFQSQEDYFGEFYFASMMRMLRLFSFIVSISLPALYVALATFHQTIIPFKLMLTMAATREGIPFTAFIEALIMIITFELLREAGLRMPRAIGQAVSIVGAIVLGEAAVSAGIASAPIVIVAALAGICSFMIPPLMKTGAILRLVLLAAANFMGLMGMATIIVLLTIYICNKKSFTVPITSSIAPMHLNSLKDSFVIFPIWSMRKRPESIVKNQDSIRSQGKKT